MEWEDIDSGVGSNKAKVNFCGLNIIFHLYQVLVSSVNRIKSDGGPRNFSNMTGLILTLVNVPVSSLTSARMLKW